MARLKTIVATGAYLDALSYSTQLCRFTTPFLTAQAHTPRPELPGAAALYCMPMYLNRATPLYLHLFIPIRKSSHSLPWSHPLHANGYRCMTMSTLTPHLFVLLIFHFLYVCLSVSLSLCLCLSPFRSFEAPGGWVGRRAGFHLERDGAPTRKRLHMRVLQPGGAQAANHRHPLEPVGNPSRYRRQGK